MSDDTQVEELVNRVCASAKYGALHRGLVTRLAGQELAAGRSMKEAIKSTRRRLHQVSAVYIEATPQYDRWLGLLREAHTSGDPTQVRQACRTIMAAHQSSRERLPILDTFYADLLGALRPIKSVLDLACGLNPLAIPWMPLAAGAQYVARDVFSDQMVFLSRALPLLGVEGDASTGDVLTDEPGPPVQVAFLLKSVPCLEQMDRSAGERLVAGAPATYVVVSFPTASLGGRRDRGMLTTYRNRMQQICRTHPWIVREFVYDSELAYLVDKSASHIGMERT